MALSWCNGFVQLNPYGQDAIELAVDLTNRRPTSAAELVQRCESAGVIFEDGTSAPDHLAEVLDFLDRWCEVVDAVDPERRAELLNVLLAESTAHPRLTAHTGSWHIHYRDTLIPFARKLRALISSGTALHLAGRGMHRLGRCAADGCDRVYADTSRNGRQRYCSPACANRDAVRRHRARQAA